MIDRPALLATLKPLVTDLEEAIRARALETPEVAAHLEHEHQRAVAAERTAMSLEEWRDGEITQAAVAWVLGCVFVRFLEDNGLIDQALISGPRGRRAAALGYREEHFRAHPSHSDREYLEACFRIIAAFPTVASLYDERHNPLWRLGPTADGARALRETFTAIDPDTGTLVHDFTDSGFDTRFLGDLYQDLSEAAKKRYALLQTPDFVERFILDRTLTPAIDEFGLVDVRLIDPTCGSGHFLIDAFERLFALWQEREPGTSQTVLGQRCLDQIAGVDLNPYATAIARFRLLITALRACGINRLAEAPAFTLHLATGDTLLHGPLPADGATMLFDANRLNQHIAHVFETEDAAELKQILGRGYHAVVGNPPYIAVQDSALRNAYRARYASCHGKYVMTVPFMERFFELAQGLDDNGRNLAGFVGKITGNNFMKREFGAPLVERFLPSVDVHAVIDSSNAYIPGHGTPTVLVFGRARQPTSATVRVVDGIRTEGRQPSEPSKGLVWSSIETLIDKPGEQTPFVRCSDVDRKEFFTHPMTLGVGRELKRQIEAGRPTLRELGAELGIVAVTGEDDVFIGLGETRRRPVSIPSVALVEGDAVRDWHVAPGARAVFPYSPDLRPIDEATFAPIGWPWKRVLEARVFFGQSHADRGLTWPEYAALMRDKLRTPLSITWAFVATHNHFVLVRGDTIFKQSAPVIKLPEGASADQHLSLAGVLNSSVACFWLKRVTHDRGGGGIGGGIAEEQWERFYEIDSSKLKNFPLPPPQDSLLPSALDEAAREQAGLLSAREVVRAAEC